MGQSTATNWNNALFRAAFDDDLRIMRTALKNGADPNYVKDGISCLHVAAYYSPAVELLLQYGADVNARTGKDTALDTATVMEADLSVGTLLDWGAFPAPSSLHIAIDNEFKEIATMLLDAGAEPFDRGEPYSPYIDNNPDLRDVLRHYETLPYFRPDGPVTKQELLEKDADGRCALDNPRTWRNWEQISRTLAANGEAFTKRELLQEAHQSPTYLEVAQLARSLSAVATRLNAQGESLEVRDVLYIDDELVPTGPHMCPHIYNAIFSVENLAPQGKEGLFRNLEALPASKRDIPNRMRLLMELEQTAVAAQGIGGR